MSTLKKIDRKTIEIALKIYSYEKDFSRVLNLLQVNPVYFLSSLKYQPDLNEEFNDIVELISLNNEEQIYARVMKEGAFNPSTTNLMIKGRNKKRYDIKTDEEKNEDIDAIDERLKLLLGED